MHPRIPILILAAVLTGCAARGAQPGAPPVVSVANAKGSPAYVGKAVLLTGVATSVVGVAGIGKFRLADPTGSITCSCACTLPLEGEHIAIVGVPHQVVVLGRTRVLLVIAKGWHDAGESRKQ